jgi:hypothetical protein
MQPVKRLNAVDALGMFITHKVAQSVGKLGQVIPRTLSPGKSFIDTALGKFLTFLWASHLSLSSQEGSIELVTYLAGCHKSCVEIASDTRGGLWRRKQHMLVTSHTCKLPIFFTVL